MSIDILCIRNASGSWSLYPIPLKSKENIVKHERNIHVSMAGYGKVTLEGYRNERPDSLKGKYKCGNSFLHWWRFWNIPNKSKRGHFVKDAHTLLGNSSCKDLVKKGRYKRGR